MVLVMKVMHQLDFFWGGGDIKTNCLQLTAFCWNVHDGRLPEDGLADFQKERAIRQMPNFLDFAGYVVRISAQKWGFYLKNS